VPGGPRKCTTSLWCTPDDAQRRRPSFWRAECIGMGALDLALGLGTIRAAGARLEAVVPRKVEKSAVIDHEPVRVLPIFMRP
jgi:hypothetical protein